MEILGLKGIDAQSASQLVNVIGQMTDAAKTAVIQKLGDVSNFTESSKMATSRSNYISRLAQLPGDILTQIITNQDQLNDSELYSVVPLGASLTTLTELFDPSGAKVVSVRNVANQKVDAGKWFLVSAIEILYGIDAVNTTTGYAATFGYEPIPAKVFNGELEITQNGRKIFSKQSMTAFWAGVGAAAIAVGPLGATYNARAIYTLDNPKWIRPMEEIKGRMEWNVAPGAANSFIKLRLIGTVNERA
jgi:hypothetical protein